MTSLVPFFSAATVTELITQHGEKIQEILPALYHYWVCKQYAYYDQRCGA